MSVVYNSTFGMSLSFYVISGLKLYQLLHANNLVSVTLFHCTSCTVFFSVLWSNIEFADHIVPL